jgi:hypothetical protein
MNNSIFRKQTPTLLPKNTNFNTNFGIKIEEKKQMETKPIILVEQKPQIQIKEDILGSIEKNMISSQQVQLEKFETLFSKIKGKIKNYF